MNTKIKALMAISALLLVASALWPAAANNQGGLVAIAAGNGKVSLFWFPPLGKWPLGGFRLADDRGQILAGRISFAGPAEQTALAEEDRKILAGLPDKLAAARTDAEIAQLYSLAALKAAADPAFAKAVGLFWELSGVPAGPRKYTVSGLDKNGRPTGLVLTSTSVDAVVAAPLPASPLKLAATSGEKGVALSWSENPNKDKTYVVGYFVERSDGGATPALLTRKPVLMGLGRDESLPAFLDDTAPEEKELLYRVSAVDLVGRRGAAVEASVFFRSPKSLLPPTSFAVRVARGRVALTWTPNPSPYTKTILIERSVQSAGPFETITPKGLGGKERGLEDRAVLAGTTYFYRARSVGSHGDVGPSSSVAVARVESGSRLPAVKGLKAAAGIGRIRLTWDEAPGTVSGYLIEARIGGGEWRRLNEKLSQLTTYDDKVAAGTKGSFTYRVTAVGFDNQIGDPSSSVEVSLTASAARMSPDILEADGRGGRVRLRLGQIEPADPEARILVLRGDQAGAAAAPVSAPLPLSTREFIDEKVRAGETYWYKLMIVAQDGSVGEPSKALPVRVGNPEIPAPGKPAAVFAAQPFPRVKLTWAQPPQELFIVVERRAEGEKFWAVVAGPLSGTEVVDSNPPKSGRIEYRLVFQTAAGAKGPASAAVEITR